MSDVTHELSTVERTFGSRVLPAGEARVLTIARTYPTEPDDLWDACTNPQRIPRWFLPVTGDLRPGGRYQLEGNASGTVERCDPPTGFTATWEFGGDVSWIELTLRPDPAGGTRFRLEHVAHVDDERSIQYGPGALGIGWELALRGLALHLATGAPVDPAAYEAWTASADGRRFIAEVSQRWREASVAAGTDPDEARAAADRVTAFFTPPPPEAS